MENFKKLSFESALKCYDKFYVHAQSADELKVGNRGLTEAEKRDGIVFLISPIHTKDLVIYDDGVSMMLRFAGKWEDVFLPFQLIDAIVDDIASPTFVYNFPIIENNAPTKKSKKTENPIKKRNDKPNKNKKILKVDFNK